MIRIIGITQKDKDILLYYSYDKNGKNFFKVVTSSDGFQFNGTSKYVIVTDAKKREEPTYDWKDFKIAKQNGKYLVTYKVNSKTYANLNGAISSDLLRFIKTGKIDNIKEAGMVVPEYTHNKKHIMYLGEKSIQLASSTNLLDWKVEKKAVLEGRKDFFDNGDIAIVSVLHIDGQIVVIYAVKKANGRTRHSVGAAIFSAKDPSELLWRSDQPIWEQPEEFASEKLTPLGAIALHDALILYWLIGDNNVYAVSCPLPGRQQLKDNHFSTLFKKFDKNPIITPSGKPWESRATFNSAAIYEDGKVHFLYRALGDSDLSVLGYATSSDGLNIDERSKEPIYIPRESFETPGNRKLKTWAEHFVSGGGYGGVEDPRITRVNDRMYLTYVAFDGATPPRSAMSSISVEDFLNRRWNRWETPKLISAPGMVNKSAVIFPEQVNGKYVVLHRVYPNILVDYLDDLDFNSYLQGHHFIPPRKKYWDSKKIGAGAPPMKTKDGWLLIYQSVGYQDPSRYKIGAMLLDKDNPSKVLYRTNTPIIEPVEHYENNGFKAGVVYPCGAVIMDNKLHVYYGGADSFVCAASTDLDRFLHEMKHNREPKLKRIQSPLFQ